MNLEAIHPQVVPTTTGMLRKDQWKRDEGTTVVGPCCQRRKLVQPDVVRHDLRHGATTSTPCSDLKQLESKITGLPQLEWGRWKNRLYEVDQAPDQPLWALTECHFGTTGCTEEVSHERELGPLNVGEKECRPRRCHYPSVDLGRFLVGVDWCPDLDEIPVLPKLIHEPAQIGERHRTLCYLVCRLPLAATWLGGNNKRLPCPGDNPIRRVESELHHGHAINSQDPTPRPVYRSP